MGVNVSKETVKTTLESIFSASVYNECSTVTVSGNQKVGDITSAEGCGDLEVNLTQDAYLEDKCALSTTIDSLTKYLVDNKQKIEDGFLPRLVNVENISTATEVRAAVEAEVKNTCADVDVSQTQEVGNVLCAAGRLKLNMEQRFRGKTACLVANVIKNAEDWQAKQDQGANRSAGILDFVRSYFVFMVVGLIILVLFLYFFLNSSGGQQTLKAVPLMMV